MIGFSSFDQFDYPSECDFSPITVLGATWWVNLFSNIPKYEMLAMA